MHLKRRTRKEKRAKPTARVVDTAMSINKRMSVECKTLDVWNRHGLGRRLPLVRLTLAASQSVCDAGCTCMKRRDQKQQRMATDGQEKMDACVCCAAAKQDNRVILVWVREQVAHGTPRRVGEQPQWERGMHVRGSKTKANDISFLSTTKLVANGCCAARKRDRKPKRRWLCD